MTRAPAKNTAKKTNNVLSVADIKAVLDAKSTTIASVIPDGIALTPEQVIARVCITAKNRPEALKGGTDVHSFATAAIEAAGLGLLIDDKLAYIVPQNVNEGTRDNPVWRKVVMFQPSHLGMAALARRHNNIQDCWARDVHVNDKFKFGLQGAKFVLEWFPEYSGERGPLKGTFGVVLRPDESFIADFMDTKTLEKVEGCSKSKGGPWKDWPDQMRAKAIMKRMLKSYCDDPHLAAAIAADDRFFTPVVPPDLKSGDTVGTEEQSDLNDLTRSLSEQAEALGLEGGDRS